MTEIRYIEAGQLTDGTDPTYGETQYTTVYECSRCGALIGNWSQEDHTRWHTALEMSSPAPAA